MILKRKNNSGQAVLIVLLSLSVVLVVVLFILSRSITDISLSTKEEDSSRAFSAAEAGVERALVIGNSSGSLELATFDANVASFAEGSSVVTYPISLKSGENAVYWFNRVGETNYTGDKAKFCWGDKNTVIDAEAPAIEVSVYYLQAGIYKIARYALDPNSSRIASNKFTLASSGTCTVDGEQFQFYSTIDLPPPGTLQYATTKILYNTNVAHKIAIDVSVSTNASKTLPSQGAKVESAGSYGDANRSIEVYQLHPETPPIFANAIYSSSGIVK